MAGEAHATHAADADGREEHEEHRLGDGRGGAALIDDMP